MASAEKVSSGRWRGLYSVDGSRERVKGTFERKGQALAAAEYAEDYARKQNTPGDSRQPWGLWVDEWWQRRNLAASTERGERSVLESLLRPQWGKTPLNKITRIGLQDWFDDLRRARKSDGRPRYSPAYLQRVHSIMLGSLKDAVRRDQLTKNPCAQIDLPRVEQPLPRTLSDRQVAAITAELTPLGGAAERQYERSAVWLDVWLFALQTGCRPGEVAGLHWNRLNLDTAMMTVQTVRESSRSIKHVPKGGVAREVPLSAEAVRLIEAQPTPRTGGCGYVHTDGEQCDSGLVFRYRGKMVNVNSWSNAVSAAGERAGVTVTGYYTRHAAATRLAEAGVTVPDMCRVMGWKSPQLAMRYTSARTETRDQIRRAFGG